MIFLTLFLIPLLLILGNMFIFKKQVTFKEFLLQMGAQAVVAGIACAIIYCSNTWDTEVHNGRVASKVREEVSCRHSYRCNCYTTCSSDSNGHQSCTEYCSTCYEHSYDVEWPVYTTNNERIEINTIDRQGVSEPPRWSSTKIGEPTSLTYSYTNYVKAAPDTLFRHQGLVEKFTGQLPEYPLGVYDYYKLNRLVQVGVSIPDWGQDLSEINADLGKKKQVNIVTVIVYDKPEEYFYALEQHWIGGKKNDVVIVMSVGNPVTKLSKDVLGDRVIQWVNVMAWTDRQIFKIKLRDDLRELHYLDKDSIMKIIRNDVDSLYERKSMSDFKYLTSSITPTKGQWIVSLIIGIIICIGLSIFVVKEDVFNEEWRSKWER